VRIDEELIEIWLNEVYDIMNARIVASNIMMIGKCKGIL